MIQRILRAGIVPAMLGALCAVAVKADSGMFSLEGRAWRFTAEQGVFDVEARTDGWLISSDSGPVVECGEDNARYATLSFGDEYSLVLKNCEIPPQVSSGWECASGDRLDMVCAFPNERRRSRLRYAVEEAYGEWIGLQLLVTIQRGLWDTLLEAFQEGSDTEESVSVAPPVAPPPPPPPPEP